MLPTNGIFELITIIDMMLMFLKILIGGWDLIKRPNPYSGVCLGVTKKRVNESYAA